MTDATKQQEESWEARIVKILHVNDDDLQTYTIQHLARVFRGELATAKDVASKSREEGSIKAFRRIVQGKLCNNHKELGSCECCARFAALSAHEGEGG